MSRIGIGFDTHRFSDDESRQLVLGGVKIDGHAGLIGHSDADVVAHAITDAVLGAAGLGDMGQHFPDTDPAWKNADSIEMLRHAIELISADNLVVGNVDCTVITEKPKISTYRDRMTEILSEAVQAPVNVKASRAEGMGAIGRVEGVACYAVVLLKESN